MIFGFLAVWFGLESLAGVGLGYLVCLFKCSDSRLPLSIGRVMIPIGVGLILFLFEKRLLFTGFIGFCSWVSRFLFLGPDLCFCFCFAWFDRIEYRR